ncbi:hypothetical protein [Streptomyces sp. SM12]|uniref:hypothetical protein n=1 Tax=Streptomyces sp. SM12 TaxID=1071602 RepID=UPI000CD5992F|nr:hypothetical protein [Streptomyces sp. SM12]
MRQTPDPATTTLTVRLSQVATRALVAHHPEDDGLLLNRLLEQIAGSAPLQGQGPAIEHHLQVDKQLLARAQDAAAAQGVDLAEAIESALLHDPLLLPSAALARLLGTSRATLKRALANSPNAPIPVNPDGERAYYDAREVVHWWPHRRNMGRFLRTPE